jgi:hypothetical protein
MKDFYPALFLRSLFAARKFQHIPFAGFRKMALRGLVIGIVLQVCSTVTLAQVGPESGFVFAVFYPTAQVGVAYGHSEFDANFSIYQPYTYLVQSLPDTVRAADGSIEAEIEFDSSGQQTGLPPGITLGLDGYGRPLLSGTPTATGTFKFVVIARDADWGCNCGVGNMVGYITFTITVSAPNITFTGPSDTLTAGTYQSAYTPVTFAATGGTPSYSYMASGLPAGMSLDASTGVLSGTPASAGTFPFLVVAYDQTTGSGAPYFGDSIFYLTINPVPLTITASNDTMTYGANLPTLTASYSGFVGSDNASSLTTAPTLSTTATASSPVGSYGITAGGAVDPNYTITYGQPGTLTIKPATLTVTAGNDTMTYGGAVPALNVAYSGFVNGDNLSSLTAPATATTTAASASAAGTYPITATGAADSNYTINYVAGTLTIGPATLTVTADSVSKTYGSVTPVFPLSFSGFVNGDNSSSLGLITAVTPASHYSPVGTYPITPGNGIDPNYTFVYVPGILTITPATATVTATDETMTYGGIVPALGVTYSGFIGSDNASSLTTPATATTAATSASATGTYPITAAGAVDSNYTFTYAPGTMTIGPATLTVTAGNDTMTYGGIVSALNVAYSGFVNGDNTSNLTTPATATTTATSVSAAGTYPITAAGAADTNYSFVYVPGTLMINPASLNVVADSATKVYGTPDPTFRYTVSGWVNGDSLGIFIGSLSRDTGANVGAYPITQGTLSAGGNYILNYTGNVLTITQAPQTITWLQTLLSGCDTTTQLQLTATASSGLPITYTTSNPGVATVAGDELTLVQSGTAVIVATQPGDKNHFAAPPVADTLVGQSPSLVRQHWGDVLFFDNSSDQYDQWQWYKNGTAIPGATGQYYNETPSLNGQYYVIATGSTGQTIQTCPLSITGGSGTVAGGIQVFPNPVRMGASVTVVSNYSAAALQGALMQIVDMSGKIWQQIPNVQPSMQVIMPTAAGIYTISLQLSSGQKTTVNVLVND